VPPPATYVGAFRGLPFDELAARTTANFNTLFDKAAA